MLDASGRSSGASWGEWEASLVIICRWSALEPVVVVKMEVEEAIIKGKEIQTLLASFVGLKTFNLVLKVPVMVRAMVSSRRLWWSAAVTGSGSIPRLGSIPEGKTKLKKEERKHLIVGPYHDKLLLAYL